MPRGLARGVAALASALAVSLVVTACGAGAGDDLAQQYLEGSNKGYVSGEFRVVEIEPDDRGEPVEFAGVVEDGAAVSSEDYLGDVLVVNFWFAACAPCRVEAPMLEEVAQEYEGDGVEFLGVNTYDQPATALSFAETYGVTYPSVIDIVDGQVKLAFAQVTPVQATPTTLVLDREGRVSARIIGQIPDATILSTLVGDVAAETP